MFKVLEDGEKPIIKTKLSAGADLCSREDVTIRPGETKIIPLGVMLDQEAIKKAFIEDLIAKNDKPTLPKLTEKDIEREVAEFEKSVFFELNIRSSTSLNLIIRNGTGQIDYDYNKAIGLIVYNPLTLKEGTNEIDFDNAVHIKKGEAVAQIKPMRHLNYLAGDEYRLNHTRDGGYGSTNIKK